VYYVCKNCITEIYFIGKRTGNGHFGKLELSGNTLLISFFRNRALDWREPNSNGIGLVSTTSMLW
jgi:hypothetical protein